MLRIATQLGFGLVLLSWMVPELAADEPTAGKQVEQALELKDGPVKKVPYLIYLPEEYKADSDQQWPLMLFLHGRGESYGPLSLVTKWGPPKFLSQGRSLPYIVVSPQCPGDDSWSRESQQGALVKLLDFVESSFLVDRRRVYLTGLSMGGYGSWRLAAAHAERFAAVVPICGGGRPDDAAKLKNIPIWVWHGDQDRAVPFSRSQAMVSAITGAGGNKIRFTTLEGIGHNSWSAAYATPELYSWLNKQRRSSD